jgi:hypothetical protein
MAFGTTNGRALGWQNVTIRFIQAVQQSPFSEKTRELPYLQSVELWRATPDGSGIAR